jgi:ribosome-associated protein
VKHPVPQVGPIDDLIEATLQRTGARAGLRVSTAAAAASGVAPEKEREQQKDKQKDKPRASVDPGVDERLTEQLKKGVAALLDKKAEKLVVLNLQGLTTISDYFVLATAGSNRQAQALSDAVELALKAVGRRPLSIEGYSSAAWILLDYGDVVFHVFHDEARRFYGLERLWGDAPNATAAFR